MLKLVEKLLLTKPLQPPSLRNRCNQGADNSHRVIIIKLLPQYNTVCQTCRTSQVYRCLSADFVDAVALVHLPRIRFDYSLCQPHTIVSLQLSSPHTPPQKTQPHLEHRSSRRVIFYVSVKLLCLYEISASFTTYSLHKWLHRDFPVLWRPLGWSHMSPCLV